jgi:hypothetical protein
MDDSERMKRRRCEIISSGIIHKRFFHHHKAIKLD